MFLLQSGFAPSQDRVPYRVNNLSDFTGVNSVMNIVQVRRRARQTLSLILLVLSVMCLLPRVSRAQTPDPQREQLLNGLRILMWPRQGDQNVVLKLRIHSGAAFDVAGKAGTMALLADILFPDAATHDYFTQEMGGRLEVETDHDAINITLQGRGSDFDRIVDILRGALVTTALTPENVVKVRDARINALAGAKPSAGEIADRAIAGRLLGSFPYANPARGTAESLARIERADLMLARERFLSPNNATLVIIGGVEPRRAMRALRQLLGGWRKSDELVPASFRQPAAPDLRILIADSGTPQAEVRLATRGLARSDHDYFAATLLAAIARDRWQKLLPDLKASFFVRQDAYALPGVFLMGASVDSSAVARTLEGARSVLKALVDSPVTAPELDRAKNEVLAVMNRRLSPDDMMADQWLDIDTYSLSTVSEQLRAWNAIAPADLQKVAARLFRELAIASVVVGNAEELKAQLGPNSKIEMPGEAKPKEPEQPSTTTTFHPVRRPTPILPAPKNPNPLMKSTKPATKPD